MPECQAVLIDKSEILNCYDSQNNYLNSLTDYQNDPKNQKMFHLSFRAEHNLKWYLKCI